MRIDLVGIKSRRFLITGHPNPLTLSRLAMSREAFAEVQKKLVDTQKQYRHMQQQQATTQREALQAKLTADELAKVSGDAPVYKAIGAPAPPPPPPPPLARRAAAGPPPRLDTPAG
jgi:hypothetical protein